MSFYAAFLLAVLASLGILWRHHAIEVAVVSVAAAFATVAVASSAAAL